MLKLSQSILLIAAVAAGIDYASSLRVVCYWNGKSFWREGTAKVTTEQIRQALPHCTHLIYGFAGIDDDDYTIEPIDKKLDLDKGKGQYRATTLLKRSFPGLTILLSLGGNEDVEEVDKYFTVLESQDKRTKLINSIVGLLREYQFDGIDLAWEFPPQHEKYQTTSISSIWHKIKKTVGIGVDGKAKEHRDQFVALVRELKASLRPEGKQVSISVLPHVNSSIYFDVKSLTPYVDLVNLWTVDYRTPERTPDKADFSTPLSYVYPRIPFQNVDATVRYWLDNGADRTKLMMGIATWGRSWKLTADSGLTGVPPLTADGPGKKGPHTKTKGILAYYETCVKLVSPTNPKAPAGMLRRMVDTTNNLGVYAYRLNEGDEEGIWVSYEEPSTAAGKALYAKQKGLGGVAILDIGLDDPSGICDGSAYPITRSAKTNLDLTGPQTQTQFPLLPNIGTSNWNITAPQWLSNAYNSTVQQIHRL